MDHNSHTAETTDVIISFTSQFLDQKLFFLGEKKLLFKQKLLFFTTFVCCDCGECITNSRFKNAHSHTHTRTPKHVTKIRRKRRKKKNSSSLLHIQRRIYKNLYKLNDDFSSYLHGDSLFLFILNVIIFIIFLLPLLLRLAVGSETITNSVCCLCSLDSRFCNEMVLLPFVWCVCDCMRQSVSVYVN